MKALIVYGSKRGGTAGLAEMIAAEFRDHGWDAETRTGAAAEPVGDVDIVVIGGALYVNHWHRDARRFVHRHEQELADLPVWMFSSGPLDDTARAGDVAPVPQVQALARRVEAHGHMTFGGFLAKDAKGFTARVMAKNYAGDFRDPGQVAEWVARIIHDIVPVEAIVPAQRKAPAEVAVPVQRRTPATKGAPKKSTSGRTRGAAAT